MMKKGFNEAKKQMSSVSKELTKELEKALKTGDPN